MTTAAIICEYNPFHRGHERQLCRIRQDFGSDTRILAVMSGNYVQRGTPALLDKFSRAEAAVRCGVNLVLSLPFPFSVSGADYFARYAVSLIEALGIADILSFGCETDAPDMLMALARLQNTPQYEDALQKQLSLHGAHTRSFAQAREVAILSLLPQADKDLIRSPNNILAVAYLRAMEAASSGLHPHFVLRNVPHDTEDITDGYASASCIRRLVAEGRPEEAFAAMPAPSADILSACLESGRVAANDTTLSAVVLSSLRLHGVDGNCFECTHDLQHRLLSAAETATSYHNLIRRSVSASYPEARVRRAVLHAVFGTTADRMQTPPAYTQVLGMDEVGRGMLKEIKKRGRTEILTKPADADKLSPEAASQATREAVADALYPCFFLSGKVPGDTFLRMSPFCL